MIYPLNAVIFWHHGERNQGGATYITLQHGPQNDFHELGLAILRALCWLGW